MTNDSCLSERFPEDWPTIPLTSVPGMESDQNGNRMALMSSMAATVKRKKHSRDRAEYLSTGKAVSVYQREKSLGTESRQMGHQPCVESQQLGPMLDAQWCFKTLQTASADMEAEEWPALGVSVATPWLVLSPASFLRLLAWAYVSTFFHWISFVPWKPPKAESSQPFQKVLPKSATAPAPRAQSDRSSPKCRHTLPSVMFVHTFPDFSLHHSGSAHTKAHCKPLLMKLKNAHEHRWILKENKLGLSPKWRIRK